VTDTVIVGAGPAGLAVGACLKRVGHDVTIVEKRDAVGWSWRNHYERLHLHTTRGGSALPYRALPRAWPRYPSRAQVVEYLEDYARAFELTPKFGTAVTRARRDGDGWQIETSGGRYAAANLVVASGYNAAPYRPTFDGEFTGELLHSSDYKTGADYKGKRVLVVGAGNTGAEIALDLCEQGADTVDMCVRSEVHVVARDMFGIPAQTLAVLGAWIPRPVREVIFRFLIKLTVGNLSRYGLVAPKQGVLAQIDDLARIPLLDIGTVALIKRGRIRVRPGIKRFSGAAAEFGDGERAEYDAVVLATGFRCGLDYIEGAPLDERGRPRGDEPGLYFVGFRNVSTGLLREIAREAKRVARAIMAR